MCDPVWFEDCETVSSNETHGPEWPLPKIHMIVPPQILGVCGVRYHTSARMVGHVRIAAPNRLCQCLGSCLNGEIMESGIDSFGQCEQCRGTGRCPGCQGAGNLGVHDVPVIKLETTKKPDGSIVRDHITVMRKITKQCPQCGGGQATYRNNTTHMSPNLPIAYTGVSPEKGKSGTGICRACNGLGKLRQLYGAPAVRKLY